MTRDRLSQLGDEVRDVQDGVRELSLVPSDDAEIHALVLRARQRAGRRRRLARAGVLIAVVASLAIPIALWPRPGRLSFDVDGVAARENAWIAAGPAQRATLSFSEGSRVELEPSTRARVLEVGVRGARVVLETGLAGLRLAERRGTSWQLSAGPFEISLGAAHCDVLWEPDLESLEVVIYEGRAHVTGPVVGDGRIIERGQRLSVGVREQRATLSTVESIDFAGAPLPSETDLANPAGSALVAGDAPQPPASPPGFELPSADPHAVAPAVPSAEPGAPR